LHQHGRQHSEEFVEEVKSSTIIREEGGVEVRWTKMSTIGENEIGKYLEVVSNGAVMAMVIEARMELA
jgi:hypothetical protein